VAVTSPGANPGANPGTDRSAAFAGDGLGARRAALDLVHAILGDRASMADLLATGLIDRLAPAERAAAQRLAGSVLRHLARIEAVLTAFIDRRPPPAAEAPLRLMVAELLAEGTPPHAAVDSAVRLVAGAEGGARLTGLVNAVGRRVAAEGQPIWQATPPKRLPRWIARPVAARWGEDAVRAIEASHEAGAAIDLTPRDPAGAADLAAATGAALLPTGSLRLPGHPQVSALPGHDAGDWWVQDAAAALPVRLLGDPRDLEVLDLCAAPGGKTMQMAAAGARVTALDISGPRMARLAANLARTGLAADCVVADAMDWQPGAAFDAVIVDAPCTATGTIRRHPDLPHVRSADSLAVLTALQAALLDRAAGLVAPGGRLLYVTCSLLPEEGEDQAAAFLARQPGFAAGAAALPPGCDPAWLDGHCLRTRPDFWPLSGGMDGFFAAVFARKA
jgi:16S rRNA (cytosine967-C5)-methyltransferase